MFPRKFILGSIPLLTFAFISLFTLGQNTIDLSQTYTSADGSFTFHYPAGWYAEPLDGGRVDLENTPYEKRLDNPDALRLEISPPIPVSQLTMMGNGTTPAEFAQYTAAASAVTSAFFSATPGQPNQNPPVVPTPVIVDFTVDGRPAAWVAQSYSAMGIEIATMTIFVDVGSNTIVSINAAPYLSGGMELINRYRDTILAIAGSLRYTPLPTPVSANANLPQTFTGQVGVWGLGDITFNYPADWYTVNFVAIFIQNTQQQLDQHNLQSGQMQAAIIDPATNMALIKDWKTVVDCTANPEGVTALAIIQKQLPSTPEQQAQVAQAGITYSEPESLLLNGKEAVLVHFHQNKQDILVIDIDLGNGNIAGLMAFAPEGEMSRYEETLKEVVGTFSYTPKPTCNPPTARPPESQTAIANSITPSPSPTSFYATAVPDQKIALISIGDAQTGWQIFLMDTNGENRQQLTHDMGLYGSVDWSPDGKHIAYILFGTNSFLSLTAYVMNADGSDVRLLMDQAESVLAWSPDGQRIALSSKKSGNQQLYTIGVDGSNLRQITTGSRDVYGMSWSPDGRQIVFGRSDYNLYMINADGTGEYQLTNTQSDESPAWSPDGQWIAFTSGRARTQNSDELFVMRPDGSEIRQLTNEIPIPTDTTATPGPYGDYYSMYGMVWSPDAKHIAFFTKTNGDVDAFVIDPDGSNLHHIASNVSGLSWSPDSQHVVFSAGRIGEVQNYVANADGSGRYALGASTSFDQSPEWSPNLP